MTDTKILETFYNKIVPEARMGQVDCYFMIHIPFHLMIDNKMVSECIKLPYDDILVPTLKVTNQPLFDRLLVEYVKKALTIYSPDNFAFLDDLNRTQIENLDKVKEEYLIKYIISTLFANASFSDFEYPVAFLQSRIAMFDHKILSDEGQIDLGYIESIRARIYVTEEVSPIKAETPFRLTSYLEFDDGYKLSLPEIYAGNNGKKYILYGIQKTTKSDELEERPYLKQIRKGLIAKINGAPEHYFLAVMLFLSLCHDQEIEVVPYLIERWNAKKIAMFEKNRKHPDVSFSILEKEQDIIQNNITNVFIRYFTKLEDVTNGMNIMSVPFEIDEYLHLVMQEHIESRSVAFNELFQLVNEYKKKNITK